VEDARAPPGQSGRIAGGLAVLPRSGFPGHDAAARDSGIASTANFRFFGLMQLELWRQNLRLVHTWTIARGSTNDCQVVLVRLTAAGVSGLGEASPISRYHESIETVERFLRQLDPGRLSFADVPGSMAYVHGVAPGNMSAKCAVNIALLDGAAQLARQPLYDYLGLGFRERQHVSSFSIGIDTPEKIRLKVRAAESFPILKLKVGVENDEAMLAALREMAPTKPVRVDANEGWTTKEMALRRIEWLARDGHIQYVEQPMPSSAPAADWVWLKERSPLMIFADESYHTAADIDHCAQCFHGVNVKLVKTGGVSAGFEALQAARQRGLKTMLGCMIETSVLISAGAHLAELCDYLDLDGNILTSNDPYAGVTAKNGVLSFAEAPAPCGLRVQARA
jgi:L-alanine-DL-glutamate epimerase-like enolase superfamily enzyme